MPIGVSTYRIQDTLPEDMQNLLPAPEDIAKRLESLVFDDSVIDKNDT